MYLSKGQKGTLAPDNRGVCVAESLCVLVCVCCPLPAVTDARLFLCQVCVGGVLCG